MLAERVMITTLNYKAYSRIFLNLQPFFMKRKSEC